jgi:hypothetical protein
VKSHIANSDINLDDIAPIVIPENPPWLNSKPTFNLEFTQYKKSETNPLLIEFTLIRRGNELQSNKNCISFCIEDRTGRW